MADLVHITCRKCNFAWYTVFDGPLIQCLGCRAWVNRYGQYIPPENLIAKRINADPEHKEE